MRHFVENCFSRWEFYKNALIFVFKLKQTYKRRAKPPSACVFTELLNFQLLRNWSCHIQDKFIQLHLQEACSFWVTIWPMEQRRFGFLLWYFSETCYKCAMKTDKIIRSGFFFLLTHCFLVLRSLTSYTWEPD